MLRTNAMTLICKVSVQNSSITLVTELIYSSLECSLNNSLFFISLPLFSFFYGYTGENLSIFFFSGLGLPCLPRTSDNPLKINSWTFQVKELLLAIQWFPVFKDLWEPWQIWHCLNFCLSDKYWQKVTKETKQNKKKGSCPSQFIFPCLKLCIVVLRIHIIPKTG